MTLCCSKCNFTANFESALMMHKQLYHQHTDGDREDTASSSTVMEKARTMPSRLSTVPSPYNFKAAKKTKSVISLGRSSSATRLFEKLRSRICKSKAALFAHPEETVDAANEIITAPVATTASTAKSINQMKVDLSVSHNTLTNLKDGKETFACHLCSFDADRITVLDRHLLNDHKIGLENLLKLVMAKTKDGLSADSTDASLYGIRQPYYKPPDKIYEEGEFVVETVSPKIKILKHASTNTDIKWSDLPDLKDDCRIITKELEKLLNYPVENGDKDGFLAKMQKLSECMSKFVDSSNTLKKVLVKEFETKHSGSHEFKLEPFFDLSLGDLDSPREWDRPHSEKVERSRHKLKDVSKSEKQYSSDSFYF